MKNIAIFFITLIVTLAVLVTWYVIVQNQKDADFKLKNLKFSSKKEKKSDQMQYQKKQPKKQKSKSAAMSKHGM